MKKTLTSLVSLLLVLSLTACSQTVAKSNKPRITTPEVVSHTATLVEGNSEFAFDLYQALKGKDGNLFYSPYSISTALAMTYAGARGDTEKQMADTLHFTLPQDIFHPAFNTLDIELGKRGKSKGYTLNFVNAIWGQKDYTFSPAFLDVLAENYGAGMRIADFENSPEQARTTINNWVSGQTRDRIKDLVPQGAIDAQTCLVLTNAIYFNAPWEHLFKKEATANGQFHLLDGGQVTVPMMKQTESLGYAAGDGYQAVELPYEGGEISMVILLPDTGEFQSFEEGLQAKQLRGLQNAKVTLTMPKFEFDSDFSLKDTLAGMGMPVAFSDNADFSGMTGQRGLWISDVFHKAFVSVSEAGTEAAAATAVVMTKGGPSPVEINVNVTIDRPFIFLIRDIKTGTILFVGRVLNPGK